MGAFEKHFSVKQIAALWGISPASVRRLFEHEPGVLHMGHAERRYKRSYITLLIPQSIAIRVHEKLRTPRW
jgi:hypothetical protein